ncbi:hypothetical protein QAD02_019717 [Eretmocerus hayati]|uniref:Uncharacterized protein n=1 Tax=Eretmocerus hayati TaxID=131215 RepID=A0ACC2PQ67_9HYME|nr:hypothetical protein QAD02_019717 [Eretmocerus hayati]
MDLSCNNEVLLKAACEGNLGLIKDIFNSNPNLVEDDTFFDYKLIVMALKQDQRDTVDLLLALGCRVNDHMRTKMYRTPLYCAVALNDIRIVEQLLMKGASICQTMTEQETPLTLAMRNKQYDIADLILSMYNFQNINPMNQIEITHFLIACERNQQNAIKMFVESGVSVNSFARHNSNMNFCGYTPLHFAVQNFSLKVVEYLLHKCAILTARNSLGLTPLCLAYKIKGENIPSQNRAIIDLIIDTILSSQRMQLNVTDDESREISYFHIACSRDNPIVAANFLKSGMNINRSVSSHSAIYGGFTALHFAVYNSCIQVVDFLLNQGANINVKTKEGWTALTLAITYNNERIVELLLNGGADTNFHHTDGLTPLQYAFKMPRRNYNILHLLLSHDSKTVNHTDHDGLSHFHIACALGKLDAIRDYLKSGASINDKVSSENKNFAGFSPLHFAVAFAKKNVVRLLLQHGAKVNDKGGQNVTPLHLSCAQNYIRLHEIIKEQNLQGAPYSSYSDDCESQVQIVDLLLKFYGDPDSQDVDGATPLYYSLEPASIRELFSVYSRDLTLQMLSKTLYSAQRKIMELLLAKGADVNIKVHGFSLLHKASLTINDYSLIKCILKSNSNVNAQDDYGRTPLHLASLCKNHPAVSELLQHGADINIVNKNNQTVLCSMNLNDSYNFESYSLIKKHLKRLMVLGIEVSDSLKSSFIMLRKRYEGRGHDFIDSDDDSSDDEDIHDYLDLEYESDEFCRECREELQKMRSIKVNAYSNLYDLLKTNSFQMVKYVRNDTFKNILMSTDFPTSFPIYGYLLQLQYKYGLQTALLMNPARNSLNFLTGFGLPDACAEQIFKHLDHGSLKNLVASVHAVEAVKRKLTSTSLDDSEPFAKYKRSHK